MGPEVASLRPDRYNDMNDLNIQNVQRTKTMPATKTHPAETSASKSSPLPPARPPKWLRNAELAEAMQEADRSAQPLNHLSREELALECKRRLRSPIEFIGNPEFDAEDAADEVFAESLELAPRQTELGLAAIRRSGVDLPIHLSRLCEAPLLKPAQERMLFQRMNFLRHHAAKQQSMLNPKRPSRARLELIDRLLTLADWHRDRIVEANLRLVFSIVKKFVNQTNNFDELLSDGIIAIMRAVEKFDYDRGFRFSTYATQVVRRNSYRMVMTKQDERQKIVGGLQDMDIDISDEDRSSAISEKRWHALRSRLALMLNDLDRREKFIIRARFSLGSHRKVQTLQALANRLGVSKERVRQLERRAMDKLRAMAGDVSLAELDS